MRKLDFILVFAIIISVTTGTLYAQKQNYPSKAKDNQTEQVDTRIDNMRYWNNLAEQGIVPKNPVVNIPAAQYTGSEIVAKGIKGGKDDSPDVPVTDATNVSETENSIFVDPTDNELLLNSNNSTSWTGGSVGTLYGANYFLSEDAGITWGGSASGAGGGNSGDPATAINLDGSRMYVGFIHSNGGQGVARSTDGGNSWQSAVCGSPPGGWDILDKNHMWIDNGPTSPYEGNIYSAWTAFGNSNADDIEIVRSSDGGISWSSHMNISSAVNAGSHNQGVNLQTGPNGEVYAIWAIYDSWPQDEKAIGFAKSTDGGATFASATRIIDNIRGIRNTEVGKNHRNNSFPVLAVDISNGAYNGNLYAVWTNIGVPGINSGSDADVYVIKSEDGGDNWSDPIRINQDPSGLGKKHYFPWITCDPETGILSVIFYDDRNVGSSQCEVFCANSFDGGETWEDFKVSDVSFTPSSIPGLAGGYMGDYLGIVARGSMVYPTWTDNRDGLYMTYVSPYVTNNLPKPTNLVVTLDEETGETDLIWEYQDTKDFLFFNVYRDGTLLGTTNDTTYSDVLPDYGIFSYSVTAMHDDGESVAASASIQWGNPHISVTPEALNVNLEVGASTVETVTVENVGELELEYTVSPLITSKKSGKDYCGASGGCDEYISKVVFGTIDNTSSCDEYADYTDQSTIVSLGETYDITVENGNTWDSDDLGVWIDWNQDQDFEDAGENVVCEGDNGGQGTYAITIPADAIAGQTTMRVRIKYSGPDCGDPCGSTSYGEVEDYSIYVLGWLQIDNYGGTIPAGGTEVINVSLDATDLDAGVYTADLNIGSNDPDNNMVTVPITLNVGEDIPTVVTFADPAEICEGESSQLNADATGGSGSFTYSWTSVPEGFTSTVQNPVVTPEVNTIYIVAVFDGTFTVYDSTTVNVVPLPTDGFLPVGETMYCQDPQNSTYTTSEITYASSYVWQLSPEAAGSISGDGTTGIVDWNSDFSGEAQISVYGVNNCGDGQTFEFLTVTINPLPNVDFDLGVDSVNIYTPEFELTMGSPLGGIYEGNGVYEDNGSYYFNPETAGMGDHIIIYTYIDENECENYAQDQIYVGENIGINEIVDGVQIEIFPNPSDGKFTIKLSSGTSEVLNLRIVNNLGEVIYQEYDVQLGESFVRNVDLSGFSEGLYFITLNSSETNYMKKIIITK